MINNKKGWDNKLCMGIHIFSTISQDMANSMFILATWKRWGVGCHGPRDLVKNDNLLTTHNIR